MRTAATLLGLLLLSASARAAMIDVNPGPGTPLQDAIDGASPGDRLKVHAGTYPESIVIDKSLRIQGDGAAVVTIDAGCLAATTIGVAASDVKIDNVRVTGGTFFEIDIQNRNRVSVKDSILLGACVGVEYGVNVFASTRVKVRKNQISGYADAGIYVGAIPLDGNVKVQRNNCSGNDRGILLEDSHVDAKITLRTNFCTGNVDGIFLNDTQDAYIAGNQVMNNTGNGIWANATSTMNKIFFNDIFGSGNLDIVDDSSNNCWKVNDFGTGTPNVNGCP